MDRRADGEGQTSAAGEAQWSSWLDPRVTQQIPEEDYENRRKDLTPFDTVGSPGAYALTTTDQCI